MEFYSKICITTRQAFHKTHSASFMAFLHDLTAESAAEFAETSGRLRFIKFEYLLKRYTVTMRSTRRAIETDTDPHEYTRKLYRVSFGYSLSDD